MIVPTMQSEERINSWWRSRLRYRFQITLPHPTIAELGICGELLAFFTQSPVDFHEMTDADNPQHFGSDPADIGIRMWINPENLDSNPG